MGTIRKISAIIRLCRLNKPLLAIPFIFTVTFSSSAGALDWKILLFDFIAVTSGFMIGNIINGIADAELDALNPRTMNRPMVKGELSKKECFILMGLLFFVLIYSTYRIDPLYILFLPIPASLIIAYSFLKRITWLCHACMGMINGAVSFSAWGIFHGWKDWRMILAGAMLFFWTLGFELLYSCQDYEYDKKQGMHSIPIRFGIKTAGRISMCSYIMTCILMAVYLKLSEGGYIMAAGIAAGYLLILVQHLMIRKDFGNIKFVLDSSQIFSTLLALFAAADYYVRLSGKIN